MSMEKHDKEMGMKEYDRMIYGALKNLAKVVERLSNKENATAEEIKALAAVAEILLRLLW